DGKNTLALDILEHEKDNPAPVSRLARSAQPQQKDLTERAILRFGDRSESATVTLQLNGAGQAHTRLSIRQLNFPSEDIVRVPALYRDMQSEAALVNPTCTL